MFSVRCGEVFVYYIGKFQDSCPPLMASRKTACVAFYNNNNNSLYSVHCTVVLRRHLNHILGLL